MKQIRSVARRLTHHLAASWCHERAYANPESVGWKGWIEIGPHALAFRDLQDRLVYRW